MKSVGRPNILFLFSDQQRADSCGCYGQPLRVTPHLDRMAAEGVLFRQAYTCQPVCGPARAALQTGVYPTAIGCHRNDLRLPERADTIARRLRGAGYETGYLGKWHLASSSPENGPDDFRTRPVPPDRRGGFDDFWLASDVLEFTSHGYDGHMFAGDGTKRAFPEGRYRVDAQTDWLLEYLETRDGKRPFFMFCSYLEPHHQNDRDHFEGPHGSSERFGDFVPPGDLARTDGNWRNEYPDYLGACASLDENLGRIRKKLDELCLTEQTIVIYTSDHGCHFQTRNDEYKRSCHDACLRIPLVIAGPGFSDGRVEQSLVSLIDLPATLMAIAGLEVPRHFHGHSLEEVLRGERRRAEVFAQISESHVGRAVRTERFTYSVRAPDKNGWHDPSSDSYVEDFLYDNELDPHQRTNLVASKDHEGVRAELRERLIGCMVAAGEARPRIGPACAA
jgi:uncharacterized sulfatase